MKKTLPFIIAMGLGLSACDQSSSNKSTADKVDMAKKTLEINLRSVKKYKRCIKNINGLE